MKFVIDKVSEDAETKQHVLVLRRQDGEDRLALNIEAREVTVLQSLLGPEGVPGRAVLEHLRDATLKGKGQIVGIQLMLYGERSPDGPSLTPVLVVRKEGSPLDEAMPASLAHAAAWSLSLDLPIEIEDALIAALQSTVTIIPGEVPSAFQDLFEGLDEIDKL
jgi:hypothetical protein